MARKRRTAADLETIPARNGKTPANGDGRSPIARSASETAEASAQKTPRTRAGPPPIARSPPETAEPPAQKTPRPRPAPRPAFRPRMPMGEFLFAYLHERGVKHSFGVPGDFALPTFAWLEKSPIRSI